VNCEPVCKRLCKRGADIILMSENVGYQKEHMWPSLSTITSLFQRCSERHRSFQKSEISAGDPIVL
jgi:SOS-response transcriptional repressor LexA